MASIQEKKRKKRHHQESKEKKTEETLTLEKLKTLGHELLSSKAHINNLPILLSYLSPSSPFELSLEALISIQSFFVPLAPEIPSKTSVEPGKEKDPELVYKAWLRERFDEFVNSLIEIAVDPQSGEALKDVAVDAIMDFVKLGKNGKFQTVIYHRFLHRVVHNTSSVDLLLDLYAPKYFKYLDVRYFTYTSLDKIAKDYDSKYVTDSKKADLQSNGKQSESSSNGSAVNIIHDILSLIPPLESVDKQSSYEIWSQSGLSAKGEGKLSPNLLTDDAKYQKSKGMDSEVSSISRILKKYKLKFTKAWLSFLRLPLPLDIYKEVLVSLHQTIFPYMANPAILCDFLTRSYDIGGVISVMALSGLFILMTKHGLEYPKFYEKLYGLLTPAVFMAKHRAMFLQLVDTCLKSSHLPAYTAAAFAKKLSRLSLSVPPHGALVIVALIHNLLRRHPSINFLVHKEINEETEGDASVEGINPRGDIQSSDTFPIVHQSASHGVDPFRIEENDPSKSNAMRSSLWEMDTLRHHYCPPVSRNAASLENDLTIRSKTYEINIADFSSVSYTTIYQKEVQRRIKQVPVAFYNVTPTTLFWESDFPGWSFGGGLRNTQEAGNVENDDTGSAKKRKTEGIA